MHPNHTIGSTNVGFHLILTKELLAAEEIAVSGAIYIYNRKASK
jgi:hypothetical protein